MTKRQRLRSSSIQRRQYFKWAMQCTVLCVFLLTCVLFLLPKYDSFIAFWPLSLAEGSGRSSLAPKLPSNVSAECRVQNCVEDYFSFYIRSGAASVLAPMICFQNNLVLSQEKKNVGYGINIVVINGKTGETLKMDHFNMYEGEIKPLVEFLQDLKTGTVVMMVNFDDPATKLTPDARKLIGELGSSVAEKLAFRDNWIFVGGKGAVVKSSFERHVKSDPATNVYDGWPEIIDLQGCIPRYLE
ncbi:protein FAM3C-like [Genypterus blacodes]|uniref:protein FAM3C-like n=1 Tax=Genypterus blacodes TaxID=154954 RepID=UPI003F75D123